MTRTDARERREKIAVAARKLESVEDIAQEFGVSAGLVRRACREFGVTPPKSSEADVVKLSRDHVLADLRSGKSPTDVAQQYRVPEQKILRLQTKVVAGQTNGKRR